MDRGGGPGAEGDNPVEARGLEEAGEPEHRRWPRLRRKRLHRRRGGGGRGSVSRSDLLANMIFISSARRQLSDSSIPSHLSQKTDSNNTFSYRRKRISVCTLKAGRGICSFLPGPGLDSMLGNKRPKWPTTHNAKRPRSPTATKHSESPTPSRPPHHTSGGGGDPSREHEGEGDSDGAQPRPPLRDPPPRCRRRGVQARQAPLPSRIPWP